MFSPHHDLVPHVDIGAGPQRSTHIKCQYIWELILRPPITCPETRYWLTNSGRLWPLEGGIGSTHDHCWVTQVYIYIYIYILHKTMGCHDSNFVITGGTGGCHKDNLRCHRWWQCWNHDTPVSTTPGATIDGKLLSQPPWTPGVSVIFWSSLQQELCSHLLYGYLFWFWYMLLLCDTYCAGQCFMCLCIQIQNGCFHNQQISHQ